MLLHSAEFVVVWIVVQRMMPHYFDENSDSEDQALTVDLRRVKMSWMVMRPKTKTRVVYEPAMGKGTKIDPRTLPATKEK